MKAGFIGAGKMAEAMMASLLHAKVFEAHEIFACDLSEERRSLIKKSLGVNVYSATSPFIESVDILILAVKPQDLEPVLKNIAPKIGPNHLVVSIAAGRRIAWLESRLPGARIVRVMPNLPCQVSEGMSAYCLGALAKPADAQTTESLLTSFGKVLRLPEDLFDAVTALSGSGPAFFVFFMEKMVEAGILEGLSREDALLLCEQTMMGTSRLLLTTRQDPRQLIQAVASAKGTTAAGLAVFEKSNLDAIVGSAVKAAADRSREMADS